MSPAANMHSLPERQVFAMASLGNQDAFMEWTRRSQRSIRGLIAALTPDIDSVDDLAQEVYLRAWQNIRQPSEIRDPRHWLKAIARNVCRESWRSLKRRAIPTAEIDAVLASEEAPQPEKAEKKNLLMALRNCIADLSEKSQRVLKMRYEEGRVSDEMAKRLSTSAVAVRKTLERARASLRTCVEKRVGEGVAW